MANNPYLWDFAFDKINKEYTDLHDIITLNFPKTNNTIQQIEADMINPVDDILTCFKESFCHQLPDDKKRREIDKELDKLMKQTEQQFIDFNKILYYNVTDELRQEAQV